MKPVYDRWMIPLAVLATLFLPVACATRWRAALRVPRQGWWEERGPVVPHDGFPADCTLCHQGDDWHTIRQDFEFDHLAETGEPLNGAHALAECLRCHNDRGPVELFAQRGCSGCHEDVHRGQMGADCTACHGESSWRPEGPIARHAATRLPLAGAHAALQCWVCHAGASVGNFRDVDPSCATCHMDDYQATTNPDHVAAGYPTTCEDCHGFVAFDQAARFSHAGISAGCADCHLDDYQRTTDPDHEAQLFATSCEDCHGSTTTWQGARYAGHLFPITSGPHGNRACSACHLVNTNYASFSCTHCHEHARNPMDDKHRGEGGYAWESGACYRCHPNGRH